MGIVGGSSVASAWVGVLTLALSILASNPAVPAPAGRTIEDCDAQVREDPHSRRSYECYSLASRYGHRSEAISRLEGILRIHPDRYHAMTTLGSLVDSERGEALLREAAELAATREDRAAEALARSRLAKQLDVRGESDEAAAQFEQAALAARSGDDPVVLASVLTRMGFHAYRQDDYGRALRLFRESDSIGMEVELPEFVRFSTMKGLGGISTRLGRYDEAMEHYGRQAELSVEMGDRAAEASARYNLAFVATKLADQREIGEARVEQRIREALDATIKAENRRLEGMSRLLLGRYRSGAEALEQFERASELLRHTGPLSKQLWAMREVAREKIRSGPGQQQDEGFRILDEAAEIALGSGDPVEFAKSSIARAFRAFAAQRPRAEWIGGYLRALDAVESIRDLQPEGNVRAQAFTLWIYPYYSLSGFLLDGLVRSPSPQEDIELAFHTMERMRSRQLLDTLDASGTSSIVAEAHPLHARRERVLQSISQTQKELMNRSLPEERRTEALVELESLEAAEADLRDRLAREDRAFADLRAPQIPSLEEVREALGPGQAMLLYQLWNRPPPKDFEGIAETSWLLVVTSGGVDVLALPERQLLEKQIEVYEGLFENRDGSEAQGSVRFYEDLIEAAVDRLPDSIDRLVIVPDSILYRFPFAALRADATGRPLATRYTITYVPSATLWMRWKRRDSTLVAGALSLADPEPLNEEVASEVRSAAPWIDGLDLGPLPHGRREAEAVVRSLGGVIRVGQDASERFLKTTDVSSFGLVHFAAHAVIDQRSPERSAILLAPGSEKEDGLLQAREIVALDFDECIVVLSACRSASGELLEGEGVVGLAHAFFQAGARAVVGSLWPIRDREAADLMEHLSAHLARGESVSKSLAAAQRALIEDGAPTAAWAGLVVLGDGDSVSVRADPNRVSTGSVVAVAALLTAVTGLIGWRILAYRRRLRSRDDEA